MTYRKLIHLQASWHLFGWDWSCRGLAVFWAIFLTCWPFRGAMLKVTGRCDRTNSFRFQTNLSNSVQNSSLSPVPTTLADNLVHQYFSTQNVQKAIKKHSACPSSVLRTAISTSESCLKTLSFVGGFSTSPCWILRIGSCASWPLSQCYSLGLLHNSYSRTSL